MQRRLMEQLPRASWTARDNITFVVACLADGDHRQAAFALSTSVMLVPDLPPDIALAREVCTAYLGMLSHPPELCLEAGQRALATLDALPADTPLPHLLIARDHREYRCLTLNHIARNQIVLGDWDAALRSLDQAGRCGHPLLDHAEGMFRAWVHGLRGDAAEAQRLATRSLDAADFWPEVHVLAVEARLALVEVHLLQGRIDAALQVADEAVQGALARRSDHHLACALVAVAEAELRSGRTLHARAALDRIGDGAYGFVGQRADAIRARTLLTDGEAYDARTVLRNLPLNQHTIVALADAVAAGIDAPWTAEQILAWEPPPWRSALHALGEARAVLTSTSGAAAGGAASIGRPPPADPHRLAAVDRVARAHDLSERETEILLGLLAGQTLADVAERLYISRNTLKTHLRSIYRKLGVHTRDEAVQVVVRAEMEPR
jgi:DNA-binding CsgD family transcriptional regulator